MTAVSEAPLADTAAVIFDAYGTLLDVTAATRRLAGRLGDKAAPLASLWRQKQLEYTWLRSLRGDFVDFWHITGEALDYAMAVLGVDDTLLRSDLMALYLALDAYPSALPVLTALKSQGRKTAILSNGAMPMLVAACRNAGLDDFLDDLLSVDAVKVFKPHPNAYQLAVDRFREPPALITFVSANGWDAAGAAHFGFRTVWINRLGAEPERLPGVPEAVVGRLDAILPLFGLPMSGLEG